MPLRKLRSLFLLNEAKLFFLTKFARWSLAGQGTRRTVQFLLLYPSVPNGPESDLYGILRSTFAKLLEKVQARYGGRRARNKRAPAWCSLMLSPAMFSWDDSRVSKEEMKELVQSTLAELQTLAPCGERTPLTTDPATSAARTGVCWQLVSSYSDVQVYRRPVAFSSQYEYKVIGRFTDISAEVFFQCLVDVEYRKHWDSNSLVIEVLSAEAASGAELVRWLCRLPPPLSQREYIYVRNCWRDPATGAMAVQSRALSCPLASPSASQSTVRVTNYWSSVVVRPHHSANQNGLDYVMIYFNDPKAVLPPQFYSFLLNRGLLDFLKQIHAAAVKLPELREKYPAPKLPMSDVAAENGQEASAEGSGGKGGSSSDKMAACGDGASGSGSCRGVEYLSPLQRRWWTCRSASLFDDLLEIPLCF